MKRNYASIPKFQWPHHWSLRMENQFLPTIYNGCNCLQSVAFTWQQFHSRVSSHSYFILRCTSQSICWPYQQFPMQQESTYILGKHVCNIYKHYRNNESSKAIFQESCHERKWKTGGRYQIRWIIHYVYIPCHISLYTVSIICWPNAGEKCHSIIAWHLWP